MSGHDSAESLGTFCRVMTYQAKKKSQQNFDSASRTPQLCEQPFLFHRRIFTPTNLAPCPGLQSGDYQISSFSSGVLTPTNVFGVETPR